MFIVHMMFEYILSAPTCELAHWMLLFPVGYVGVIAIALGVFNQPVFIVF